MRRIALLVTALLALSACSSSERRTGGSGGRGGPEDPPPATTPTTTPATRGDADVVTERRPVSDFQGVAVDATADVRVRVGGPFSVMVTAEPDVVDRVTTDVRDGTLVIGARASYSSQRGVIVEVEVPALDHMALAGAGRLAASGVSADSFRVSLPGSGEVRAEGRAGRLVVRVDGSGNARLFDLQARRAEVRVGGAGNVDVTVAEAIDALVTGAGNVVYDGRPPTVVTRADGSGRIRPR